ncbi:MAG: HIT family protein [Ahrensia sp.]|nr:HIT family protein [Ahrensia sp.]
MQNFKLDPKLYADTWPVTDLGLCQLLLMNDARYTWFILVPQRVSLSEIFELTPSDQTQLMAEISLVSKLLKQMTNCTKINVGALGNIVRQLHIHVIARHDDKSAPDLAWPGPVWGNGVAIPYDDHTAQSVINRFTKLLTSVE